MQWCNVAIGTQMAPSCGEPSIYDIDFPGALWLSFLGQIVAGTVDIILFILDIFAAIKSFFDAFGNIFNNPTDCITALGTPSLVTILDYIGDVFDCLGGIIDFSQFSTATAAFDALITPTFPYQTRKRSDFGKQRRVSAVQQRFFTIP